MEESIDGIIGELKVIYSGSVKMSESWNQEESVLRIILQALVEDLNGRFELQSALGVGGSGVVIGVRDIHLDLERALKFSRPSPGKQALLAGLLTSETDRLVELSHPYVMRIHTRGSVSDGQTDVPYYVMDRYVGVDDCDEFVARHDVQELTVLQLLEKVLEGVAYIHSKNQVHLDIKPGNILVRENGDPVIADLGFTKALKDDAGLTLIGGTEGFIHPDARRWIDEASSDPNRLRGEAPRFEITQLWDLFSLGRTFLALLDVLADREDRPVSLYSHRYLRLMACRMLDGHNEMNETLLGLSLKALKELKYDTAAHAHQDLRKLNGGYSLHAAIPEMNIYISETIQASTFATTPFTSRVEEVIVHPEVMRLGGFTQLSLLNLVFPTASHTRLEHSIGVFSATVRYLAALYYDPINPLFCQIMREEDLKAALLAALLHDIGHYALAHDLEEADYETFSHESRGLSLLRDSTTGLKELVESACTKNGDPGWGVPVGRLVDILSADVKKPRGTLRDRLIHALIDGPIDADKLDYIIRDSTNLGLSYGSVIDVERLLRCLTVTSQQIGDETVVNIGIHEKGRVTAEAVAFARYALYGSVYWHHAYRSIKAMIQRIAWEYLEVIDRRDERSHEGIGKIVEKEFYAFLRPTSGAPQSLPLTSMTHGDQLHPGDRAVLDWMSERAGDTGIELAAMIKDRRLFKRVLVLSHWGNANMWQTLNRFSEEQGWRLRLRHQREFQKAVVVAVERIESFGDSHTTMIFPDARNSFLAAASRDSTLLLLDIVPVRAGASTGLELVEEDDRRRAKIDEIPTAHPEMSEVWESLRRSLQEAHGKVRVFCHPDHYRFLSAIDRTVLESAIEQSLRAVP